jgi:hypothetical protein
MNQMKSENVRLIFRQKSIEDVTNRNFPTIFDFTMKNLIIIQVEIYGQHL